MLTESPHLNSYFSILNSQFSILNYIGILFFSSVGAKTVIFSTETERGEGLGGHSRGKGSSGHAITTRRVSLFFFITLKKSEPTATSSEIYPHLKKKAVAERLVSLLPFVAFLTFEITPSPKWVPPWNYMPQPPPPVGPTTAKKKGKKKAERERERESSLKAKKKRRARRERVLLCG